jgi:TetR/AcrR family transcriptional regulator, cholesterol catabolism regulator
MIATDARERVLEAAERLFAERGYASVTLRDVAAQVGIRHASLYHHVPGGKEELFVEVTERGFRRHADGLGAAIRDARPDIRARLHAAAGWFLSQPPVDAVRMINADMPAIDPEVATRLSEQAYASTLRPLEEVFAEAARRGETRRADHELMAGAVFGMVQSLFAVPEYALTRPRVAMAHEVIDVLLEGLRPR